VAVALHFKSVEHEKLNNKYGPERGVKIGKIYGTVSGTMEFIFLVGLWISPQPRFFILFFSRPIIQFFRFSLPIFHLIISFPLIFLGAWIAIRGVLNTGLETAETHSAPKKIVKTGAYSTVRHPQYLGWILDHVGFSILLSALYSMLFTPILIVLIYLISKKEEDELVKEFGKEYEYYKKRVPMFIPRVR
jgi:protein-S-isoprenylcysteine O-methyltransferase Ste14